MRPFFLIPYFFFLTCALSLVPCAFGQTFENQTIKLCYISRGTSRQPPSSITLDPGQKDLGKGE
ncbi:MAG: hypothetical protein WC865_08275 [Bacteroidales bacterium]